MKFPGLYKQIFVVGIEPHHGRLDMQQLNGIAGDPENVVIVKKPYGAQSGFGGLTKMISDKITAKICGGRQTVCLFKHN